ncbi:MAG: serine--tRNA ligase [Chitinophagaceae bacterium]|nr:serine--tRNA ligase [Chitinophagaceae bacterium]
MLQVNVIRQDAGYVKERLAVKGFSDLFLVDEILALDDRRKKLQLDLEQLQSRVNSSSKAIGQLIAKGQKAEAEAEKQSVAACKSQMSELNSQLAEAEKLLQDALLRLPNLPSEKVPPGKTPEDNVVVREGGLQPQLGNDALPHWDLIKNYGIVDFETGSKITGTGFPLYKGLGAKLQRALVSYFLDFNTAAGYIEFLPPFMVNEASGYGTGQLPDKEGQMYYMPADNYYLIPTAEVPVTNIYRDEIIKEENLPVKMTAYSPCFRREAGSFGKDVRGLNRVHQFEKVEIVQITHPDKSYDVLEEMVNHVEKLLNTLQLPYRILKLCGGDMSFTSALTYDFEVYSAAQNRWLEVSSVSNFETYQANRAKIRFKDRVGKNRLVHTLNGSSLALPRIFAALLENNQQANHIALPEILHSYFGADRITLPATPL